jgi:hypothetical protein
MTDPQLSLIVTDHIDPSTQVTRMPGTDAECPKAYTAVWRDCAYPFCTCFAPPTKEDE